MNFLRGLICLSLSASVAAQTFPAARPEEVGLSAERLERVDEFIARLQREKKLAGAVTVIARHGKRVALKAHGFADVEAQRAMRVDDLFQLQSMTKPIATVAALQLVEQGRMQLTDPVARFLPEFAAMTVAVARADGSGDVDLVPASRPITILDLLTHRAGFAGGLPPGDSAADRLRRKAVETLPPASDLTVEHYVKHLAASPLDAQPGTVFRYGAATVVLGRVIEVVTGQTLDVALRERVLRPLGMTETFFTVPEAARARVAPPYALKPSQEQTQGLTRLPLDPMAPRFFSAGGNLFGTAMDYLRFCQMLLDGGEFQGTRVLSRKSVELMTATQVDPIPLRFLRGHAFGLGVAVQKAADETGLAGSPGTFGWSGGYNTYFRIDPVKKVIIMLFTQLEFSPFDLTLLHGFHDAAMRAVDD